MIDKDGLIVNKLKSRRAYGPKNPWMNLQIDEWIDCWMEGSTNRWKDQKMEEIADSRANRPTNRNLERPMPVSETKIWQYTPFPQKMPSKKIPKNYHTTSWHKTNKKYPIKYFHLPRHPKLISNPPYASNWRLIWYHF